MAKVLDSFGRYFRTAFALCLILSLASQLALAAAGAKTVDPAGISGVRRAFDSYEEGIERLLKSAKPEDRAAAIRALATVASRRYEAARDALLDDPSPEVRIAVLDAIGLMGDLSPKAVRYVEDALAAQDREVAAEAIQVEYRDLRAPLTFHHLWNTRKANYLWGEYLSKNGWMYWTLIRGVGETKPWLDPAWAELADGTRKSLLFHAGTRESVALAIQIATAQSPPNWAGLLTGEPADLPFMQELLKHPRSELRQYASRTLLEAKDPSFLSALHSVVREYHQGISDIPASALEDFSVGTALALLDESELNGLLQDDPAKWFQLVSIELEKRGKPISYSDLRGRRQPSPLFNISRVRQDFLRGCQLRALIREQAYQDLPDFVTLALTDPNPAASMSDLAGQLGIRQIFHGDVSTTAWNFRAGLPQQIAKVCHDKVADWLGKSPQQGGPPATNPNGADSARLVVALLASAEERQAAWQKLRGSKDPFRQEEALQAVLWGCDRRGDALRRLLAAYQREPWFSKRVGYSVSQALHDVLPDTVIPDPCAGRSTVQWFPFSLPASTPAFSSLRDALTKGLSDAGIGDQTALARAFLALRNIPIDVGDPFGSVRWLAAPESAIRSQVWTLLSPALGSVGLTAFSPDYQETNEQWAESARIRLAAPHVPLALPPPAFSAEERTWVEGLLREERRNYFSDLVDGLIHPKSSSSIGCGIGGYSPPSPSISMPSDVFMREAGMAFEAEIRDVLRSPETVVRHAAALALWKMLRDPLALAVFAKDASDTNTKVRASALWTLQSLRRQEAAPLFPHLLTEKDALLRQVGVMGIRTFDIQGALPDVLSLVADQDVTTAGLAVGTLGQCRFTEARPLLLRLILDGSTLADTAAVALTNFRTNADLDAFLAAASKPGASEAAQIKLLGVVSEITRRPGPQPLGPYMALGQNQKLQPGTLDDWKTWWTSHRQQSPGERAMNVLGEEVRLLLSESDEKKLGPTQGYVKRRLPGLGCVANWGHLSPQCHDIVAFWWASHEKDDAWTLFTSSESDPWMNLDLLLDVDPQRTRRLLFTVFYHSAKGDFLSPWPSSAISESAHDRLVRFAHADFGDPGPARCGTKEKIVADWLAWAQKEGWAD